MQRRTIDDDSLCCEFFNRDDDVDASFGMYTFDGELTAQLNVDIYTWAYKYYRLYYMMKKCKIDDEFSGGGGLGVTLTITFQLVVLMNVRR